MTFLKPKALLFAVFLLPLAAGAQPPAPAVTTPAPFSFPLERSTYFIGESVPIELTKPGAAIELIDGKGAVAAGARSTPNQSVWRLDTSRLAPGEYSLRVAGATETAKLILVSAQRPSPGALFDEVMPDANQFNNDNAKFHKAIAESGLDAFVAVGQGDGDRYSQLDELARYRAMLWTNLYTRPNSFIPARVYLEEMEGMAQRGAHVAAMNARYPNFGGLAHTWDPTGFDHAMLLVYWNWTDKEKALRAYNKRSLNAVYDEFRKRTGLEPVTTSEYLRYAVAIGHPEFASIFDLPTAVWSADMAKKSAPMPPAELAALEKRVDAWAKYATGVLGESNAFMQKWMKQAVPGLTGTASMDNEFVPREGGWPSTTYAPLDFRWVEAWSDQVGGPDYAYQWLFHAALTDVGARAGQPVWVGSVLNWAHHQAAYPGRFSRAIAHNMAYDGRGMGFALEGFSNIVGGMYDGTQWWNMKGTPGEEDVRMGREWLRRFAPLQEQSTPVRKVGVLLSLTQYGRQYLPLAFDKPQFNAFITLARLGYTPRFVTEEEIEKGGLQNYGALVVVNQTANLPTAVLDKLKTFQTAGGKVLLSKNSTATIPDAIALEVNEPFKRPGRPHNWISPNAIGKPSALIQNDRFDELAPAYRAALGDALRTPLVPEGDEKSRISTFALGGGSDATYLIATNDSFTESPSTWTRQEVTLHPTAGVTATALYDLSDEKYLGVLAPVKANFTDRTARLYALLARPVESLDARATQQIAAGEVVTFSVAFLDKAGKPLRAAIPFYASLNTPDGAMSQEYYRSTAQDGTFAMQLPLATNAPSGHWTLSVRSYLDGKVLTLPVEVRAAGKSTPALSSVDAPVIARGDFASLWKSSPSLVAPIFDGPNKAERLAAAKAAQGTLAAKGVKLEIVEAPVISTYALSYDPTPEELAENARADKSETFGQIKRMTVNGNDYFATKSGWSFGRPVLLFDTAGVADDPMAEAIDNAGMLWPKASASFPGTGRATIQIVKSAFKLGQDAVVVQASDAAGLLAGAKALTNPPADWISPGVESSRVALTRGFSIGRAPQDAVSISPEKNTDKKLNLTNKDAKSTQAPQPLALTFDKNLPPLPAEVKAWQIGAPPVSEVPGKFAIPKAGVPYMKEGDKWIRADTPGGDWPSDLRFSQATLLKVKVPKAGKYRVDANGIFRFSDRKPNAQSTWEEILDVYMKTVQPKREAMSFEVLLDDKPLGALNEVKTAEVEVVVHFGGGNDVKEKEEGGVAVSGVLVLPTGEHELLLIPHNIVDGLLKTVDVAAAG